jgi:RNA 3'-phosphate cyclase
MEGLKAVAELCSGRLEGAEKGSEEIWFYPGKIRGRKLDIKISTAGSIGLVFQVLKLPASKADREVEINISGGATFGKWAPPLLASKNILLPVLEKTGYRAGIEIERHGFYPAGGARVSIRVSPCREFRPLVLEKLGEIKHAGGISIASTHLQSASVAERQARAAENFLKSRGLEPRIKEMYVSADCPGSGIVLWASDGRVMLGGDSIGERGKNAKEVGREAAQNLFRAIRAGATVDEKLSDQVLVFMAFARGRSGIAAPRLTKHAETNIWVIKKFLDVDFEIKEREKGILIECSGRK